MSTNIQMSSYIGLEEDVNWEYGMRLDNNIMNNPRTMTMAFDMLRKMQNIEMSHIQRKRITHECSELIKVDIYNFNIVMSEKNEIVLSFKKMYNKKHIHYTFVLNDYPFKTPIIHVNEISLENIIKIPTQHLSLLKDWKQLECLCCHSFLSNHNWSALISFPKIIDEINRLIDIKVALCIMALMERIKDKYLVKDIDLSSWIYA